MTVRKLPSNRVLVILRDKTSYLVEQAEEILRRAGRARQWVKALRGLMNGVRFEIILGLPSPAELRAWLGRLGMKNWTGLQVAFERLADLLGVQHGIALATMQLWRG